MSFFQRTNWFIFGTYDDGTVDVYEAPAEGIHEHKTVMACVPRAVAEAAIAAHERAEDELDASAKDRWRRTP